MFYTDGCFLHHWHRANTPSSHLRTMDGAVKEQDIRWCIDCITGVDMENAGRLACLNKGVQIIKGDVVAAINQGGHFVCATVDMLLHHVCTGCACCVCMCGIQGVLELMCVPECESSLLCWDTFNNLMVYATKLMFRGGHLQLEACKVACKAIEMLWNKLSVLEYGIFLLGGTMLQTELCKIIVDTEQLEETRETCMHALALLDPSQYFSAFMAVEEGQLQMVQVARELVHRRQACLDLCALVDSTLDQTMSVGAVHGAHMMILLLLHHKVDAQLCSYACEVLVHCMQWKAGCTAFEQGKGFWQVSRCADSLTCVHSTTFSRERLPESRFGIFT